ATVAVRWRTATALPPKVICSRNIGSIRPSVSHAATNPIAMSTVAATAATTGASDSPAATIGYSINHNITRPGTRSVIANTHAAMTARATTAARSGQTTGASAVRSATAGAWRIVSHE